MKKVLSFVFVSVVLGIALALANPPNDLEPWTMYQTYENGYDAGKTVLQGSYGNVSLLQGCMGLSDHSSWEKYNWDDKTIRKVEQIYFYGCINAGNKKMTKEKFMKEMFKDMFVQE